MSSIGLIDLRSDTVTLPTGEMLDSIKHAKLGDDVFNEDPTVNELEKMAAEKMSKEAALLVTSGTQANLISLMSNTKRGDLAILESESHIYWYERGGVSAIAGLLPWPLQSQVGALDPMDIENAIRPKNIHFPEPALICIENTHNRHGGTIIEPYQIKAIREVADKHGLKFYMDGARIFNAAIALKIDVKELARDVDNLMFCLSKGLCCPVGSLLVGTTEFIEKARKVRKILGGGMRQAGIIAAPGIIALDGMVDRLSEDHKNARLLAEGICKNEKLEIDLSRVQTNIVCFDISGLGIAIDLFISKLQKKGIFALAMNKEKVRMVTHNGIEREHVEKTIEAINDVSYEVQSDNSSMLP
jgi:threonine aldolase